MPDTIPTATQDSTPLFGDYESFKFEIMSWEELDPSTFTVDGPDNNDRNQSWFEKYINHKIKFFAYLNFFNNDPEMSKIQSNFNRKYTTTLDALTKSNAPDPTEKFKDEAAYNKQEDDFVKDLQGTTKDCYLFFRKHYDTFFNKIGDGFFVKINNQLIREDGVIKEGNRAAKKILPWNQRTGNYMNQVLRAYPLLYYSPKNNNALAVQYVCFIDGFIRNSIDYYENDKIYRIYLPILGPTELTIPDTVKSRKIPTFTTRKEAMNDYLKNNGFSLHFDPDAPMFESNVELEEVSKNSDLRGCSIY